MQYIDNISDLILMSGFEPIKYTFKTQIKWQDGEIGRISSEGKKPVNIALPENLGGPGGSWSPDELFVSSVEACVMLTFFWLLKNYEDKKINIISYESETEGISQIDKDGLFRFTKLTLTPTIVISNPDDKPAIERVLKKLDSWCCISNSIKTSVIIEPTVKIELKK